VEAKACNVHILGPPRDFQQLEDSGALQDERRTDAARLSRR